MPGSILALHLVMSHESIATNEPAQNEIAPNIVLIVADDMGWRDVGYHGSEIETPTLDAMAASGIELDRFYVQPTCSPTRAALMTGKSPARLGIIRPISKNEQGGLPLEEKLLPAHLRDAGYQTFMSGKWHLGHVDRRYFPHNRGFDSFYGFATGGIGYWDHNHGGGHDWQRNGVTLREEGYSTHLITNEAIRRLETRDPARPTFLYVAYNAPHLPNEAPEAAIEAYAETIGPENPNRAIHAAMVSELDREIGRLLATLDAQGMTDDTIVWFLSDNGGLNASYQAPAALTFLDFLISVFGVPLPIQGLEFFRANLQDGAADNSPLRGGKTTVDEGGVRVPAMISWPGHLEGRRSEAFITAQDVLPTLLTMIGRGATLPDGLDGTSRLDALERAEVLDDHADYLVPGPLGDGALYRGSWKLVSTAPSGPFGTPEQHLYRFRGDPTESEDVAEAHPEIVQQLQSAMDEWPRGPEIHGSLAKVVLDPDAFGGPEDREPWAEAAD